MKSFFSKTATLTALFLMGMGLSACMDDGETGPQGPAGADGVDGIDGEDGENGVPGVPGEPGTNCTVADTTDEASDRTGYKLLCADSLKGIVWNGADGLDGSNANVAEILNLDFYNRLMVGRKGTSLFWDGKDGSRMVIPEGNSGATWNYWTDKDQDGSSGFAFNNASFINSDPKADFTDEYISNNDAVGGKVMLKPNDLGLARVSLQVGGSSTVVLNRKFECKK